MAELVIGNDQSNEFSARLALHRSAAVTCDLRHFPPGRAGKSNEAFRVGWDRSLSSAGDNFYIHFTLRI